jgi:hypothetical protein
LLKNCCKKIQKSEKGDVIWGLVQVFELKNQLSKIKNQKSKIKTIKNQNNQK